MSSIDGRVALITGASRGIGARWLIALAGGARASCSLPRSGDDLGIDGGLAAACDVRDLAALESLAAAAGSVSAVSTSSSPTPASAPTGASSTSTST